MGVKPAAQPPGEVVHVDVKNIGKGPTGEKWYVRQAAGANRPRFAPYCAWLSVDEPQGFHIMF